jgi:hypothetical protein
MTPKRAWGLSAFSIFVVAEVAGMVQEDEDEVRPAFSVGFAADVPDVSFCGLGSYF